MKIVTFGEIMLRLATENYERFHQVDNFKATYGGGEANVAASMALFGHETSFVTRLPNNPIGKAAASRLRALGVSTERIVWGGERLGIYFLEPGASIRPSNVVYDRSHSSISTAEKADFDWDKIFKGQDWFHFTGITPALSKLAAENCLNAVEAAKANGLKISCDLNYRKKLWTREEAKNTMHKLVQNIDVIIANEEDASDVFGIVAEGSDITSGKLSTDGYLSVARQLQELSGAGLIAITLRESISASDNNWSAMLYTNKNLYLSRKYPVHIVDRVGGGDSFGAGLLHGLSNDWELQDVLEFAVAASALKQTIPGDMNLSTVDEVMKVVKGDISGRVQR